MPNLTRDGSEFSRSEVQESVFSKISLSDSDMSGPEWFPNLCLEITEQDVLLMFVSVSLPAGNKRHAWNSKEQERKALFTGVAGVIDCYVATDSSHSIRYSPVVAPFFQMQNYFSSPFHRG